MDAEMLILIVALRIETLPALDATSTFMLALPAALEGLIDTQGSSHVAVQDVDEVMIIDPILSFNAAIESVPVLTDNEGAGLPPLLQADITK